MKKYYSIIGAYNFKDKKTGQEKYGITAILQSKYPVRWSRDFYLSKEEFFDLFENVYDPKDYNLGLKGLYVVITEEIGVASEIDE